MKGVKKDKENYRPVSLTSVPGKFMEKIILGITERHLNTNVNIRHSQYRLIKGKFCLTNMMSFYNEGHPPSG